VPLMTAFEKERTAAKYNDLPCIPMGGHYVKKCENVTISAGIEIS